MIFGKLPPPVGGVTKSIENLSNALRKKKVNHKFFSFFNIFKRYDISHIHYLKRWKIIVALIIGKIISRKVILTYHSVNFYPNRSFIDRLILKVIDGIIVLNENVEKECLDCKIETKKIIRLTPIFLEGIVASKSTEKLFNKETEKIYLLVYAYDKVFLEGLEVYGITFMLKVLEQLKEEYTLVIVDPKSGYEKEIISHSLKNRIIYINRVIDFASLLNSVDIYVRPTNFDGNSVAILEALSLDKPVLASDAVNRQKGIITYKNNDTKDFLNTIDLCKNYTSDANISSIDEYIKFLESILDD